MTNQRDDRQPACLLGIGAVCAKMGLGKSSVKKLIASGELGSILVFSRRLVPRTELERFVAERIRAQIAERQI